MQREEPGRPGRGGISKVKLAIGAASLFLFIVGVKRSYRADEPDDQPERPASSASGERSGEPPRLRESPRNSRARPPVRRDLDAGRDF